MRSMNQPGKVRRFNYNTSEDCYKCRRNQKHRPDQTTGLHQHPRNPLTNVIPAKLASRSWGAGIHNVIARSVQRTRRGNLKMFTTLEISSPLVSDFFPYPSNGCPLPSKFHQFLIGANSLNSKPKTQNSKLLHPSPFNQSS